MKNLNYILMLVILILSSTRGYSTAQFPDLLIYKNDTLSIFSNPLEQLNGIDSLRPLLFGSEEGCMMTSCWRGYEAEWVIIDKELYLTGIYSCCYYEDSLKADLKILFGNKFENGKVKADWFTGNILAPQGEMIYYVHMGYESIYEKELELEFSNGKLTDTRLYDNSKSKKSIYSQQQEKLNEFIYSNINWENLPEHSDTTIKVFVRFSANINGIVDSVEIMRGFEEVFDNEAIRVIKLLPEWDVYYQHGKLLRMQWTYPVVFNKDNKLKYLRRENK